MADGMGCKRDYCEYDPAKAAIDNTESTILQAITNSNTDNRFSTLVEGMKTGFAGMDSLLCHEARNIVKNVTDGHNALTDKIMSVGKCVSEAEKSILLAVCQGQADIKNTVTTGFAMADKARCDDTYRILDSIKDMQSNMDKVRIEELQTQLSASQTKNYICNENQELAALIRQCCNPCCNTGNGGNNNSGNDNINILINQVQGLAAGLQTLALEVNSLKQGNKS